MNHRVTFEFLSSEAISALLDEAERTRAYWRFEEACDSGIPIPWR